jgi:hypothetical protein
MDDSLAVLILEVVNTNRLISQEEALQKASDSTFDEKKLNDLRSTLQDYRRLIALAEKKAGKMIVLKLVKSKRVQVEVD